MANLLSSKLLLGFAVAATTFGALAACTDDAQRLTGHNGTTSGGIDDSDAAAGTQSAAAAAAEAQFRALQSDFDKTCGNVCHKAGAATPPPPTFLGDPDPYISIKAYKGIVVKDPYTSLLVNKGAHEGPALKDTPDLEKKIFDWLKAEAVAIVDQKAPTSDPVVVANGPNDVDLTKACTAGLTGVHLKFTASLVGNILSLSDIKVAVPAGSDAHLLHLKMYKKLAAPKADGTDEIVDPQDTFSNLDVQLPNGAETAIASGALMSGDGWAPFVLGTDQVRFEVEKLEPGKVKQAGGATSCKDVNGFVANVLPSMKGQNGVTPTCSNCHSQNNPQANLNLTNADNAFVCSTVLAKLNQADITKSIIITKVSGNGVTHAGGQVNNPTTWAALFTNNKGVFF